MHDAIIAIIFVSMGFIIGWLMRELKLAYERPYLEYIEKIASLDERIGQLEQFDKYNTKRIDNCINCINEHGEVIKSLDKYIHEVL